MRQQMMEALGGGSEDSNSISVEAEVEVEQTGVCK